MNYVGSEKIDFASRLDQIFIFDIKPKDTKVKNLNRILACMQQADENLETDSSNRTSFSR
jgi:hypothetical protein